MSNEPAQSPSSRTEFNNNEPPSASLAGPEASPLYGRFSRRLKAVVIDQAIILSLLVAVLLVAVSAGSDNIGRILGFAFVGVLLLYEPLLVSLAGSTIGHYRANLRVVDNQTHGNVSFLKALARSIIKDVLGVYSFITMAATSRHQAVHDLLTNSTVQLRDSSKGGGVQLRVPESL